MTADKPAFCTVNELAARFAVTATTIRRLTNSGELPAYRVGRVLRFDPADVNAYLTRQRDAKRPAKDATARRRRGESGKQPIGREKTGKEKNALAGAFMPTRQRHPTGNGW